MFIAIDEKGNRIFASNAQKGTTYYCPVCKTAVRLKDGSINATHFAHVSLNDCDDFSSDMSEWHRKWQSLFPVKNCEHIMQNENEIHRADVCCYGTVIEFQHSSILADEFWCRNDFYTGLGYKVVWIFDVIDIFESDNSSSGIFVLDDWETRYDKGTGFRWKRPWRFLADFFPQNEKNIDIFFQTLPFDDNPKDREALYMEKVVWVNPNCETMWRYFRTSNNSPMNYAELLDWLKARWIKGQNK